MGSMRFLFLAVICLYSMTFGYSNLPQLKWVKQITSTITPDFIIDFSEERFLCADKGKIAVMNVSDGTLAEKVTGFNNLSSITKAVDNNFVIAEGNKITLLDSSLETIWSKPVLDNLSISYAIQTSDSGFAAIGTAAGNTIIIKTDKNGDTLWTRLVSSNCTVINGKRIIEVDGGLIAAGECCIEPCLWMNSWIIKYSYSGTENWTKVITGLTMYDMIPVPNGVVLTGSGDLGANSQQGSAQPHGLGKTLRFDGTNIPFIHIGADGESLVSTAFSGLIGLNWGNTIRKSKNAFILACYMTSYMNPSTNHPVVIAADSTGTLKWTHQYNSFAQSYQRPIAQPLSSGDLVVFASDSLYYYSDPTNLSRNYPIISGTNLIGSNIAIKQNRLFFTLDKSSQVQITLHSVNGRILHGFGVITFASGQHCIELPVMAYGVYVVRLTFDGVYRVNRTILYR